MRCLVVIVWHALTAGSWVKAELEWLVRLLLDLGAKVDESGAITTI